MINHYSVTTMVSIIELLIGENGSGDVDDMGKARMWREWESWGSRTRWHGRVVDRRWHLKSLEFDFVFLKKKLSPGLCSKPTRSACSGSS